VDEIPEIPDAVNLEAARIYISVYEAVTGEAFPLPSTDESVLARIRRNLTEFMG
jgi:phosphoribosylaminoimidazole-succinocarboxamide synthase